MTIRDEQIIHEVLKNGGITLDTTTNRTIQGIGYMVSMEDAEEVHDINVFKRVGKILIDNFIEKNARYLKQKENYLGIWVDNQKVYFDISHRFKYPTQARLIGRLQNQLAIFDLEKQKVIML